KLPVRVHFALKVRIGYRATLLIAIVTSDAIELRREFAFSLHRARISFLVYILRSLGFGHNAATEGFQLLLFGNNFWIAVSKGSLKLRKLRSDFRPFLPQRANRRIAGNVSHCRRVLQLALCDDPVV